MSTTSSIALSGLNAAALRLQVSASNVANVSSDGPLPGSANAAGSPAAYAALRVDQTATAGGGTGATVQAVSPSTVPKFEPTASFADSNGLVASPNVDLTNEIVQQALARYVFTASAAVVRTDTEMAAKLFNVTA
jgi:flagellar basal-body rod protein FlgC